MSKMLISVVNASARAADADVQKIIAAVAIQLQRDVAPIWGQVPSLEFVARGGKATPGGILCTISDTPDAPGAAGYHDEGPNGIPFIKVFTFEGAPALVGPEALSVTISHEILEVVGDAPANKWADGPGGFDYAYELCDAVEGDTYPIGGVSVSSFVYPAFFDPKAKASTQLSYLNTAKKPFSMTPGGYQIKRSEPGKVTQVFANHHPVKAGGRVFVEFGPAFPEERKAAKIAKAARRRG